MSECYVVTGGAGFIGSHIAERLLKDGHRVRIIDNLYSGKVENLSHLGGDLEFHEVSVTDKAALDKIFAGVDYVFHQAALASVPQSISHPLESHEINVTGTLNVLIAARDASVKRVIYAASSAVYGDIETEYADETLSPSPISPYGVHKLIGEQYCRVFSRVYGLETVCLRYFNVFGPRQDPTSQYAAVIPIFIAAMLEGERPRIFGDGQQSRDFTFIENVVYGNLLAAKAPDAAGHVINLATGSSVSLLDLVAKLNQAMGTSIEPILETPRAGDIVHSCASIERARDLLDYAPLMDFDAGLARTVAWYKTAIQPPRHQDHQEEL